MEAVFLVCIANIAGFATGGVADHQAMAFDFWIGLLVPIFVFSAENHAKIPLDRIKNCSGICSSSFLPPSLLGGWEHY